MAALLAMVLPALPAHRFYACGMTSKGWVVGMKLLPSGLFLNTGGMEWERLGFMHPSIATLDYDPRDPRLIYMAAGNGCIRSGDGGRTWRITTDSDVTELQDVAVDRTAPDTVWIALPDGIAVSRDGGGSWKRSGPAVTRKFTQTIRVDRTRAGRVIAGGEDGIHLTSDNGAQWRQALRGVQPTDVAQSPGDARVWMATTMDAGLWLSSDGGTEWSRVKGVPGSRALYNVRFDPTDAKRAAVSGWGIGVMVTHDGGMTWHSANAGLPSMQVWRVAFDPDHAGRLYASVHEEALYRSDDAGDSWQAVGLEGSIFTDLVFVPEVVR
ncbi:MAG: hypothetical protein IT168_01390 [Bryobacterales bacterium]|nr:hypothetical protein [Bryobacterales bacterium]